VKLGHGEVTVAVAAQVKAVRVRVAASEAGEVRILQLLNTQRVNHGPILPGRGTSRQRTRPHRAPPSTDPEHAPPNNAPRASHNAGSGLVTSADVRAFRVDVATPIVRAARCPGPI